MKTAWGIKAIALLLSLFAGSSWGTGFSTPADPSSQAAITQYCAGILAAAGSLSLRYDEVQSDAHAAFPEDAIRRALYLAREFPDMRVAPVRFRPARTIRRDIHHRFSPRQISLPALVDVTVNGHLFSQLRAVPVAGASGLNTMMLVHALDASRTVTPLDLSQSSPSLFNGIAVSSFRPRQESPFTLELEHGLTVLDASSERQVGKEVLIGGNRTTGTIMRTLRENGYWIPNIVPVARDNLFHASASRNPALFNLEATVRHDMAFDAAIAEGRSLAVQANSGSTLTTMYRNYIYSKILGQKYNPIRTQTLAAPVHPVVGFDTMLRTNHEECLEWQMSGNIDAIANSTLNRLAFNWFVGLQEQMVASPSQWWRDPYPLGNPATPTLFLVGGNDFSQVPMETRAAFRNLAARFKGRVYYFEIPGGQHDLFSETEEISPGVRRATRESKARAALAYSYVYWFHQRHMMNNYSLPEPSLDRVVHDDG